MEINKPEARDVQTFTSRKQEMPGTHNYLTTKAISLYLIVTVKQGDVSMVDKPGAPQ
jgi:hypothetical protein